MTTESDPTGAFWQAIDAFVEHLAAQVHDRWAVWAHGHEKRHVHEVVGGLLARQATLAGEFAANPPIWNAHSAPLFLRPMVENCITLAWILKAPDERAKLFIAYGLGQENLLLEQAKAGLRETGADPNKEPMIERWEQWLNGQRYTFLTEVNVGSWGPNLRVMAEEAGLIKLHRNDYAQWSGAMHNMWQHVVQYNIQRCTNPLHGYHRVPTIPWLAPEAELLQTAAEYVDLALRSFDEATGTSVGDLSAVDVLDRELQKIPWPPGHEPDIGHREHGDHLHGDVDDARRSPHLPGEGD